MKRQILAFLAAFVVALAGTTGVALVRARSARAQVPTRPKAATDSTNVHGAADSVAQARDSVAGSPAAKPASAPAPASAAPAPVLPAQGNPAADSADGRSRTTPSSAPPPARTTQQPAVSGSAGLPGMLAPGVLVGGRLSKIFAAMSAKEAAKVLEQMDDADVVAILGSENDRKAAEILALLPSARAAAISKSVMKNAAVSR